MGGCVSIYKGCCFKHKSSSNNRKGRKTRKRIMGKMNSEITNRHSKGSAEEDWYDSAAVFGSDTEEDFQSAHYDPVSPGPRKKAGLKFPFKWREEHPNPSLISTKAFLHRPIAGSQVSLSPIEEKVFGSWSHVEPGSFKVRAENYLRDKKKEFSSNHAVYEPFGVDVFLSQRKVDHIARYVKLPLSSSHGEFPSILVVNVQIPIYSPSIFQSENDGEGMSVALYFLLSESYSKDFAPHFLGNLRRVIDNAQEEIKGSTVPVRERLKILGRVANIDDLHLNAAERKLMHSYNGKPFLSRPQHEFYFGENYFEIDLDMHRFSYISRKGFDTFQDRLKHCILDVGLTIQGNKAEELPEQILCCLRLNGIDYSHFNQIGLGQESL
ncbi:hypothetical protein ACHQM5_008517 [Ranunculus cassubicifolius]